MHIALTFYTGLGFPYDRYIRKILDLHLSTLEIISWAESPRLRPTLIEGLEVITIHSTQTVSLRKFPTSVEGWKYIVEDVLQQGEVIPTEDNFVADTSMKVHQLGTQRGYHKVTKPKIHCEITLLEHYHNLPHNTTKDEWTKVAPYSYLGVSKLSCWSCDRYLSAYNTVFSTRFTTRGSHSKIYYPCRPGHEPGG